MRRPAPLLAGLALTLAACSPADPVRVAQAVAGTLTAVPTQTPVVVVVTVWADTPNPSATPLASATPAPSETPRPTPTATPTARPSPTASAPPSAMPRLAPTGAPGFENDFSRPAGLVLGDEPELRTALAAGWLEFTVKQPNRFHLLFDTGQRAANFHAELTGGPAEAGHSFDRYGLLFRVRDSANYYQFEVDGAGRCRLARTQAGALTPLLDWTAVDAVAIGPESVNVLAVRAQGATLEAWVNGALVYSAPAGPAGDGAFGLIVGSDAASGFTARFDALRVWPLP